MSAARRLEASIVASALLHALVLGTVLRGGRVTLRPPLIAIPVALVARPGGGGGVAAPASEPAATPAPASPAAPQATPRPRTAAVARRPPPTPVLPPESTVPAGGGASDGVAAEPAGRYNSFNLLLADRRDAFVVSQPRNERPGATRLEPGLHLLTNLDLNDPTCPRIAASHRGFAAAGDGFGRDGDLDALVARLQTVLADHATALDPRGPGSLCVHMGPYGTRSSSVLLVPAVAEPVRYFHADGPPCQTRLQPVPLPF